jgi:hypothetical protein
MYNFKMQVTITESDYSTPQDKEKRKGMMTWHYKPVKETHLWASGELDFIPTKNMIFDFGYASLGVAEIVYQVDTKGIIVRFHMMEAYDYEKVLQTFKNDGWRERE